MLRLLRLGDCHVVVWSVVDWGFFFFWRLRNMWWWWWADNRVMRWTVRWEWWAPMVVTVANPVIPIQIMVITAPVQISPSIAIIEASSYLSQSINLSLFTTFWFCLGSDYDSLLLRLLLSDSYTSQHTSYDSLLHLLLLRNGNTTLLSQGDGLSLT